MRPRASSLKAAPKPSPSPGSPGAKDTASTSSEISPACASSAAPSSAPAAAYRTSTRSATSNPEVLRASCTSRITSRARPASRSSGVISRSSATVAPASEATDHKDRSKELGFVNKRAAAWWRLRELLDPAYGAELALPPDDLLTGDLTAPHWAVHSGGRIQIESKDEIRKRLGRSPDSGDAVVQAVWDAKTHDHGTAFLEAMTARLAADGVEMLTNARDWRSRVPGRTTR